MEKGGKREGYSKQNIGELEGPAHLSASISEPSVVAKCEEHQEDNHRSLKYLAASDAEEYPLGARNCLQSWIPGGVYVGGCENGLVV